MALENIGIGGVLSFDSKDAVTSMGAASRAFGSLGKAATGARAGVTKIGEGLAAFQLMGGLGVAGMVMGFEKLVHSGMEWNEYVQTTKISIGTIMAAVTKVPLAQSISDAEKVLQHLNIVATQTHVETSEVVDTFSRLVGPMMGAGASMEQIYEFTKGTTIMASALHQPVNRASHAISMLAGGTLIAREQTIQLLHSMNLLHESSAEWAALLPEQRLKRMKEIMDTFEQSGEYLQHTWVAQASSAKSFMKIMAGAFTKGMFDSGTDALTVFNNAFMAHSDEWLAKITEIGHKFSGAITWAKNEAMSFYAHIRTVMNFIQSKLDYFDDDRLPGILKTAGHLLAQFMLFATALSPVISIVGFIGSKVMALVTIAEGLFTIITAIAVPLLVIGGIAAALFMLLRHQGESFTETMMRFWDYIKTLGQELWAPIAASMGVLLSAFDQLKASGAALWEGIQPGLASFRGILDSVVGIIVSLWESLVAVGTTVFVKLVAIFEAIRPGLTVVINGVMALVESVVQGVEYLLPKIMYWVDLIIGVVGDLLTKIGSALSKVLSLLQFPIDLIVGALKLIWPILGFIADVLGAVIFGVLKAIGWILGKILDLVGWVADKFKAIQNVVEGALLAALDALRPVFQWIADKIGWIVGKLEWVADKVGGAIKAVWNGLGDAWDAVANFGSVSDALEKIQAQANTANQASMTWLEWFNTQMYAAKMQALGVEGVMKLIVQEMKDIYSNVVEPTIKPLIEIVNGFIGHADITAKQPDVKVDVNIKNNATMCVNGRNLAVAQSAYETEVAERSGFNNTPYQTQRVQISGVKP